MAAALAASLATLPAPERDAFLSSLTPVELAALEADWRVWARPNQLPPAGDWTVWLNLGGRGSGKTWVGANWSNEQAEQLPGSIGHLVAPTASDVRDVMVEGPSGILALSPDWFRPTYEPSKRRLTWPNGSIARLFSADEPERLRGPQCHWAWTDEPAAWRYAEAWDQLLFGLRLGQRPRVVATTTPKPIQLLRDILARPDAVVTRSRTADNIANLAPVFLSTVVSRYEGTRLGRQELEGELLEDVPGALWTRALIDAHRWPADRPVPRLDRVVVALDPAVTSTEGADETGMVAAGVGICHCKGSPERHGFVLADDSARRKPVEWARAAIALLRAHQGDRLVGEVNNGGEMIEHTLRMVDPNVPYRAVHASRGKAKRAEPVSALYEQGKVHHVGALSALEDQMCNWVPDLADNQASPDRMDAAVWALTDLMVTTQEFYVV
jgi:phage terminase large subunit-like protein